MPKMARLPVSSTPWWQPALVIAAGLTAAALVGWLAARLTERSVHVIVTRFSINDAGQDELNLMCPDCPDASVLAAGSATATFEAGRAVLHPQQPLRLGENELQVRLVSAEGKGIKVEDLQIPVAFRLSTHLNGLHESPPYGELRIEAPAGSVVRVDGVAIPLHEGRAVHRVLFDAPSLGEASQSTPLERTLKVHVAGEQSSQDAEARFETTILPLVLSSIGPAHQLAGNDVTIAGTSLPGAQLTYGEHSVQADSKGHFRLVLQRPKEQEQEVVARLPALMVRRVPLWLADDAPVAPGAVSRFADIEASGEVNLFGNVLEAHIANGTTIALVEIASGCEIKPCFARVVSAEPRKLVPNRSLRIAGWAEPGDPVTIRVRKFH